MDLSFTKEDLEFQQEVRDWIAEAYTPELRAKMAMSKNGYLDKEGQVEWQKRLYEKGWVAPNWPEKYGGPGLSPSERYILNMELSAAGKACPLHFHLEADGHRAQTGLPARLPADHLVSHSLVPLSYPPEHSPPGARPFPGPDPLKGLICLSMPRPLD